MIHPLLYPVEMPLEPVVGVLSNVVKDGKGKVGEEIIPFRVNQTNQKVFVLVEIGVVEHINYFGDEIDRAQNFYEIDRVKRRSSVMRERSSAVCIVRRNDLRKVFEGVQQHRSPTDERQVKVRFINLVGAKAI